MSGKLTANAEQAVGEIKKGLQDKFNKTVADAVTWFYNTYPKVTLQDKDYESKTGVHKFWFDKIIIKKEHWEGKPSIHRWDKILNSQLFKTSVMVEAISRNDFTTASDNYASICPWAFNFGVAFLKEMQQKIPTAKIWYGEGCLVIDPEFVPRLVESSSKRAVEKAYSNAVEKLPIQIVEFVLGEVAKRREQLSAPFDIDIGGYPDSIAKSELLAPLNPDTAKEVYSNVVKLLQKADWSVEIHKAKHNKQPKNTDTIYTEYKTNNREHSVNYSVRLS